MAVSYTCDACHNLITAENQLSPTSRDRIIEVEIPIADGKTIVVQARAGLEGMDTGDLCKYCLIDAIASLDDRQAPVMVE